MRNIDRRIVEMQFDNRQFELGVKTSIDSLSRLEKGLDLDDAGRSLSNLERLMNSFSLHGIADGVDHISNRFSALGVIGFTVMQELTTSAINLGRKMSGAILEPLVGGGARRALNIERAKFQFEGLGMDVESTMASALEAVTGTAYGLDEAAVVAAQLGATGIAAGDDMTTALRSISGVAAMTGSSYSDIGQVFTTVAGNGRLMGAELLRLSSRGINAAAILAKEFGTTEAAVREMVSKGQVSFDLFYRAMDSAFGEHATRANELYTGSLANVKAGLSRIGADVATSAFENQRLVFVEMIPILRELHGVLVPAVEALDRLFSLKSGKAIERLQAVDLDPLKEAMPFIVDGLWNIGELGVSIIKPIQEAFRDIFPPMTGKRLIELSKAFKSFTDNLKLSEPVIDNIRRTFAGFFAIFSIMRTGFLAVVKTLSPVVEEVLLPLAGAFLEVTATIGDFIVGIDKMFKGMSGFDNIFGNVKGKAGFMNPIVDAISGGVSSILNAFGRFDGFDFSGLDTFIERVQIRFRPVTKLFEFVQFVFWMMVSFVERMIPYVFAAGRLIREAFSAIGKAISESFATAEFKPILDLMNTGIFAMILMTLRKLVNGILIFHKGGLSKSHSIIAILDGVRGSLMSYQKQLKAGVLMRIAIAMAILSLSLIALSMVDSGRLGVALGAMTAMFVQLFGAMAVVEKTMSHKGFRRMGRMIVMLMAITAAIFVLAIALRIIARLSWDDTIRGLTAMGMMMAMMVGVVKTLAGTKGGIIRSAAGLVIFSIAILIMARALRTIGNIDPDNLARGLVGLAVLLGQLVAFMKMAQFGTTGIGKMTGLLILAVALSILVSVVRRLGTMDMDSLVYGMVALSYILAQIIVFLRLTGDSSKVIATATGLLILGVAMMFFARALERMGRMGFRQIVKGLGAMAGVLGLLATAIKLMPKDIINRAGSLLIMAVALNLIAFALERMGNMSAEQIGKGLITLAGAMLIIGVALKLMEGNMKGAAALLVVSIALNALAVALRILGKMSVGEILKSLGALAGTLAIFGIAGILLVKAVPVLLGLAGAMFLFGLASLAVGGGVLLLSIGLASLAVSGVAAAGALALIVTTIAGTIPTVMRLLAEGLLEFVATIGRGAKVIVDALVELTKAVLEGFMEVTPLVIDAIFLMLNEILDALMEFVPKMYHAAIDLMVIFLKGIRDNIGEVVEVTSEIIVIFLTTLADALPDIIDAGFKLIISFINGMADAIRENSDDLIGAIKNLIWALIEAAFSLITSKETRDKLKEGAKEMLELGFIKGIRDKFGDVAKSARELRDRAVNAVKGRIKGWRDAGKDAGEGFISGIRSKASGAATAARNMASGALAAVRNRLDSRSPSREFAKIGVEADEGFIIGLMSMIKNIAKTGETIGNAAMDSLRDALVNAAEIVSSEMDLDPVIKPVIDLSDVREGSNLINKMLLGQKQLKVEGSVGRANSVNAGLNQNGTDSQITRHMVELLDALNKRKDNDDLELSGVITMKLEDYEGRIISISEKAIVDLLRREGR